MSDESEKQHAAMLAAYTEVCRSYHAVDDFRAKLMALLPFASGTGGAFLLAKQSQVIDAVYLGPIGLFGVGVTLGLFFYELRGLKLCGKFIKTGKNLETDLELSHGQFMSNPEGHIIGAAAAGWTIYLSVLFGWIYIAYVGFKNFVG